MIVSPLSPVKTPEVMAVTFARADDCRDDVGKRAEAFRRRRGELPLTGRAAP